MRMLAIMLLLTVSALGQTYGEMRRHLVAEEGYRLKPYYLHGIAHVGIGHVVYGHPRAITPDEAEFMFAFDLGLARRTARAGVMTFDQQPLDVRVMLVGLAFNTGSSGFGGFVRFRNAIDAFEYWAAARELRNSLWYSQLPDRAERYIAILEQAGTARLRIRLDKPGFIVQRQTR